MYDLNEIKSSDLTEAAFNFFATDAEKRLDYADTFSREGLKYLFLSNGFSIVSLLTLIGNDKFHFNKRGIFWAFAWFSSGIFCVILAYLAAYLSQNYLMNYSVNRMFSYKVGMGDSEKAAMNAYMVKGLRSIYVAIALAISSFGFFVTGAFVALVAIT